MYLVVKGQLRPLTADLFKDLGYASKDVVKLSANEIAALPTAGYATPAENTYFAVPGQNQIYLFKDGLVHSISPLVKKQRSISSDYTFDAIVVADWPLGAPLLPLSATVVMSDDGTSSLYLMSNQQLHSVSAANVKRRGYSKNQIHKIPQSEIASYPLGDPLN